MEFIQSLDYQILAAIIEYVRGDFLTPVMLFITHLGDGGVIWRVLAALCLMRRQTRLCGVTMLLALFIGLLVGNLTIKPLVARMRPFLAYPELTNLVTQGGYSFPSAHAMSSFAAATSFYLFFRETGHTAYGIPCLVLAALVALSRLYVCVHYPSDVFCGTLLGIALAFLATRLTRTCAARLKKSREGSRHEK